MQKIGSANSMRSGCVAPVVLTILDGWGHREENNNNAIWIIWNSNNDL